MKYRVIVSPAAEKFVMRLPPPDYMAVRRAMASLGRKGESALVTRLWAFKLMSLMMDLSYVYERCRSVTINPLQQVQVKGENYILDALMRQRQPLSALAQTYQRLMTVTTGLASWIAYLDKRYVLQTTIFGPPVNLDRPDAQRLAEDIEQWRASILSVYQEGTVLIKEDTLHLVFSESTLSKLDEMSKKDFWDAVTCVLSLLPTPAAMISLRVAENILRKYYERVTGCAVSGKNMGQLLQELEHRQILKQSALGYVRFLKDKRNEAEHPDKRFSQEESERILLHIKDLLDELET
ncbi:MAG: hypothetical protein HY665_09165 [Chloroflexi bacterium]|nr:hypothetical protein [Chloroflexota bacterium]